MNTDTDTVTVDESKLRMYVMQINRHDWHDVLENEYISWSSFSFYNSRTDMLEIYIKCRPEDLTRLALQYNFIDAKAVHS